MSSEELEEIELDIEKFKMRIEEKRSFLHFENAFFIPLFALLVLLSMIKSQTRMVFYLFLLAIALIIIDLIYSLVIYKRLDARSKLLDNVIKSKIKQMHS